MDRSTGLRIPTLAVTVSIAILGETGLAVGQAELFIADEPRTGRGHLLDDLAESLDAAMSFIPMRGTGGIRLVAKSAIVWIAMPRRDLEEQPSSDFSEEPSEVFTLYDRQHRVEVELARGPRLEGSLLDSSPADRPRVIDHLNRSGSFVRLWTTKEHVLINKGHILAVTELPEVT